MHEKCCLQDFAKYCEKVIMLNISVSASFLKRSYSVKGMCMYVRLSLPFATLPVGGSLNFLLVSHSVCKIKHSLSRQEYSLCADFIHQDSKLKIFLHF